MATPENLAMVQILKKKTNHEGRTNNGKIISSEFSKDREKMLISPHKIYIHRGSRILKGHLDKFIFEIFILNFL